MIALIDGDIVTYRCAASANKEETPDIAIWRCDDLIRSILYKLGTDQCEIYLSGQENFRKEIDPSYKANRVQEKPQWLETCREYLVTSWKAMVQDSIEADDALGCAQTSYQRQDIQTTICSIDKDLSQVPGDHFSWEISGTTASGSQWTRPDTFFTVSEMDGLRFFYKQLLIGDPSDNIKGVSNIGPVKADKAIDPLNTEQDMFDLVRSLYNNDERLMKNGRLLWVLRKENDVPFQNINLN